MTGSMVGSAVSANKVSLDWLTLVGLADRGRVLMIGMPQPVADALAEWGCLVSHRPQWTTELSRAQGLFDAVLCQSPAPGLASEQPSAIRQCLSPQGVLVIRGQSADQPTLKFWKGWLSRGGFERVTVFALTPQLDQFTWAWPASEPAIWDSYLGFRQQHAVNFMDRVRMSLLRSFPVAWRDAQVRAYVCVARTHDS